MQRANNLDECMNEWNKSFVKKGFFESEAYQTDFDDIIRRSHLQEITEETGNSIYHSFATILRKHSVSDKSNAYNRLFNLFLCKIIDEDKEENDILDFQWKENDTFKDLAKRLNDLYKDGMLKFLKKEITDYTDKDLAKIQNDEALKKIFEELRLYKNNEFSFIDVFNEDSFTQNMKIVKDIVSLLERYQFRYTHKHQYLGNFFELLLNTGFKQENGQFFTPVPLAEFMVKSLPLKEMIKENNSLPYIIDYACGSGHFLTEAMDEIQYIIEENDELATGTSFKKSIKAWKEDSYSWASDYVYGLDNDYRLIKTTKVACFLNGDGEANIIHTNGLNKFGHKDYKGKLESKEQFDILLANPPYSVDGFLHQLDESDKEQFNFYNIATTNTDDIECFFIERTEQLLKDGGIVGIVLPISILQNSDALYTASRKVLLQKFEIKAMLDVGSSGFMATGTNTVIIFAKKNASKYDELKSIVEKFLINKKDIVCNGIQCAFSKYVLETYEDIDFEYYKTKHLESLTKTELENEKDRIITFMLAYNQVIPIIKTGDKEEAKKFLGYEFSKAKGKEGLKPVGSGKLYNKEERTEDKVNYYVYKSFLNEINTNTKIHKDLQENIFITRISNLLSWETQTNWSGIRLSQKKKIVSDYPIVKLGQYSKYQQGISYKKTDESQAPTKNIVLTASHLTIGNELKIKKHKFIYLKDSISPPEKYFLKKDSIFICSNNGSEDHVGKNCYIKEDLNYIAGGFMGIIKSTSNELLTEFLQNIISSNNWKSLIISNGSNIKNLKDIEQTPIPLPLIKEQEEIVAKMQKQDKIIIKNKNKIEELNKEIQSIDLSTYKKELLGKCINYYSGSRPKGGVSRYDSGAISLGGTQISKESGQIVLDKISYVPLDFYHASSKDSYVKENDILICKDGALTGKVALVRGDEFSAKKEVMINEHLFIIRSINDNLIQKFLFFCLFRNEMFEYIQDVSQKSAQEGYNSTALKNTPIPLPSIKEQKEIVVKIEKLEKEIAKCNNRVHLAKEVQKQIMNKVFTIEKF